MLIIIDKRIPQEAKQELEKYGDIYELETQGIVYDAISGHPDIFVFQEDKHLIIAKEAPKSLIAELEKRNIDFEFGSSELGSKYPTTTAYNTAYRNGVFIGNSKFAAKEILQYANGKKWINSPQAYARCNSLILDSNTVISSDKTIINKFTNGLFVQPQGIVLKGFDYGFFGGCAGIIEDTIFIIGSLKYHKQGEQIADFCSSNNFKIKELYDGPLIDGGGVFFID